MCILGRGEEGVGEEVRIPPADIVKTDCVCIFVGNNWKFKEFIMLPLPFCLLEQDTQRFNLYDYCSF